MIALRGSGLSRRYGGVRALRGVDLCLAEGEIRGLIGPNGAGKTTLLDVLSGRAGGDAEGRVELMGHDVSALGPRERRRAGLSRTFQRSQVFPSLSVAQQLRLAAQAGGDADEDEVMQALDLQALAHRCAGELSHGEQRRLDAALALAGRPRVVLLDEPAAGLTRDDALLLARRLRQLALQRQASVLLIEHDVDFVFEICAQVTVLHLGEVLFEGTPAQVRDCPAVLQAYLGERR